MINNLHVKLNVYFILITIIHMVKAGSFMASARVTPRVREQLRVFSVIIIF